MHQLAGTMRLLLCSSLHRIIIVLLFSNIATATNPSIYQENDPTLFYYQYHSLPVFSNYIECNIDNDLPPAQNFPPDRSVDMYVNAYTLCAASNAIFNIGLGCASLGGTAVLWVDHLDTAYRGQYLSTFETYCRSVCRCRDGAIEHERYRHRLGQPSNPLDYLRHTNALNGANRQPMYQSQCRPSRCLNNVRWTGRWLGSDSTVRNSWGKPRRARQRRKRSLSLDLATRK